MQCKWQGGGGWRTEDVPEEAELPAVQVAEMNELAMMLDKDASWTWDVVSNDSRLIQE